MRKPKFETPDLTSENIEKIAALFPNCVTEASDGHGGIKRAINFELLKQMLSPDVVDGDEAYEFTWVGKKAAIVEANKPIRKTLRPCMAESKDWDSTENLYIEGDNLEVLKLLQESYLGKVKMIYIDPPYNTGNDFIYADDFKMESEEWKVESGEWSEEGDRLFKNTDTNGRFHSDWCSMIYSRLLLARNLLTDDGVIFISIDDNEVDNLRKICDELFGNTNFIAFLTVIVKTEGRRYGGFAKTHEQVIVYGKNVEQVKLNEIEVEGKKFQFSDENGGFNVQDLRNQNARAFNSTNRPNLRYPFYVDTEDKDNNGFCKVYLKKKEGLTEVYPITVNGFDSVWRWGKKEKASEHLSELAARIGTDGIIRIYQKMRKLTEEPKTVLINKEYISIKGTREIQNILGIGIFDFPKPLNLIKLFESIATSENSIILDFFSGSATTAHAVMQLNAEDGGHRKFIMVQLPEKCDEASEAYKAGYKNICEIGKERIRRAGEKILKEQLANNNSTLNSPNSKLDIGFRVLKLDSTNMKDVYYAPDDYDQGMLAGLESNIKDDRTDLDLLFGCLIEWGLPLSLPYKSEQIDGCTVHTYNDGDLIACFDANVPESVVKEIAKRKPLRAVFRDSGFASSPEKINVFEIFKLYMPEDAGDITKRVRVI
ncbi:MAG: site-specific DNA-methyltransferase [Christensenellales bacterium]